MVQKILLINPPFYKFFRYKSSYFPKGLGYLAAVLDANGYYTRIYDADNEDTKHRIPLNLPFRLVKEIEHYDAYKKESLDINNKTYTEIRKTIIAENPTILGISVSTSTYPNSLIIAKIAKDINKNIKIVFGGIHPTILPDECLRSGLVDFVVRGEGEQTFLELVKCIEKNEALINILGLSFLQNGTIIHNANRDFIKDLDTIPFPSRHLVINLNKNSLGRIIVSRGCPFHCTFCASNKIWGRMVRIRSTKNVVDEIETVNRSYGTNFFIFDDDTFTLNPKYVKDLCNEIIKRNLNIKWWCQTRTEKITNDLVDLMYKAGCRYVAIGIESGDDLVLKDIKKYIKKDDVIKAVKIFKKYRIEIQAFFMIGFEHEGKVQVQNTINFLNTIKPDYAWLAIVVPYPGTKMYTKNTDLLLSKFRISDFLHINKNLAFALNNDLSKINKCSLLNMTISHFDHYNIKKFAINTIKIIFMKIKAFI